MKKLLIGIVAILFSSNGLTGELENLAENYLSAYKEKELTRAAAMLHCPESYSKQELLADRESIPKTLSIFVEEFGSLKSYKLSGSNLYVAAMTGHVDAIKVFVKLGADVNATVSNGATPVLVAARDGRVDAIKALYKLGADRKPASFPLSLSDVAQYLNHTEALQLIDKIMVKLLRECEFCGCSSKRVKACAKCGKVRYCSSDCQLQDWKKHKKECASAPR